MNNTVELSRRMHGVLCVMDEELRLRIKEQRFYLVQSKARLLPPFANIVAEADALEMEYVETIPDYFDPENSDMSEVYDAALRHGLEHYDLLQDMKSRTILSIVAGMYHHFDKCIRTMLARELGQGGWVIGKNTLDHRTMKGVPHVSLSLCVFGVASPLPSTVAAAPAKRIRTCRQLASVSRVVGGGVHRAPERHHPATAARRHVIDQRLRAPLRRFPLSGVPAGSAA